MFFVVASRRLIDLMITNAIVEDKNRIMNSLFVIVVFQHPDGKNDKNVYHQNMNKMIFRFRYDELGQSQSLFYF